MDSETPFDPLVRFAEIERLAAKVYFRFSHLFLHRPELRDFWWQMAMEEEQHSAILLACKELIRSDQYETLDPSISPEKANQLKEKIGAYLGKGTPSVTIDEAFKVAVKIETSEVNVIYGKLLRLGGLHIAKSMEKLGVPASIQRQKLKSAIFRFSKDPDLLSSTKTL